MIITNSMNHQAEADNKNMVLLSQYYSPTFFTTTAGMVPQQGEASDTKPKRRQRKKNGGDHNASCVTGLKKRKLTVEQAQLLEMHFGNEHKLESDRKDKLASELGLHPRQVAVWFQNRRARDKTKKIEESYASLKTAHENVVVEKGRLESQVAKLKEKLSDAEKEIQRLTQLYDAVSVNSALNPTVAMEMETVNSPFASVDSSFANSNSTFTGYVGYEELHYLAEQNFITAVEWMLSNTQR